MGDTPWLTLAEAAHYTKTSPATLLRNVKAGGLRAVKVAGKKLWRFHVADLDRWLSPHVSAEVAPR